MKNTKKDSKANWLNERYLIVLRKEETLDERIPLRGSGKQFLFISLGIVLLMLMLSGGGAFFIFRYWQDNYSQESQLRRNLLRFSVETDSITKTLKVSQVYAQALRAVFQGDTTYLESVLALDTLSGHLEPQLITEKQKITPTRRAVSAQASSLGQENNRSAQAYLLHLFPPLIGYVTDQYSRHEGHYGIDLVGKKSATIHAVADGVVVLASWTEDSGYVMAIQHAYGLVSFYKHNAELFKQVGQRVIRAEAIATVGNSGRLSSGPHLHFELWKDGKVLDPADYFSFSLTF